MITTYRFFILPITHAVRSIESEEIPTFCRIDQRNAHLFARLQEQTPFPRRVQGNTKNT